MPAVVILGASGRLGQTLTQAFAGAGWRVLAQSRKPFPIELVRLPSVQQLACDALDRKKLHQGARGASVVINALNPPYHQWEDLAVPLSLAAQDLALDLGALLMFPGNVYNFGSALPARLAVGTPEQATTGKARIRIEMEQRMADEPGLDSVVLRAGDFFGARGRGSWFDLALASRLHKGRFVYPGPLDRVHAWAYLPDLAQCFVSLAERRAQLPGHRRLHFAGHAVEGQVLLDCLQALVERKLRPASLPWSLIRLASPLVPSWKAVLEMRYLWEQPHELVDDELRDLIGMPPQTPLLVALRQSLLELGLGELLPLEQELMTGRAGLEPATKGLGAASQSLNLPAFKVEGPSPSSPTVPPAPRAA